MYGRVMVGTWRGGQHPQDEMDRICRRDDGPEYSELLTDRDTSTDYLLLVLLLTASTTTTLAPMSTTTSYYQNDHYDDFQDSASKKRPSSTSPEASIHHLSPP